MYIYIYIYIYIDIYIYRYIYIYTLKKLKYHGQDINILVVYVMLGHLEL